MLSVLTLTAFLLREEGERRGFGGLIRKEGHIKYFNFQTGGFIRERGLIRAFTICAEVYIRQ